MFNIPLYTLQVVSCVFYCTEALAQNYLFPYSLLPSHQRDGKNSRCSLKSKKISNDQELIQSDPTSYPQNQREITKYKNWQQFTKRTLGKPNEQLFPKQVVIQLPKIY